MTARRLGLGLSGGGDSTALLLALREAAPHIVLYAYIVDHGLRPESAQEARAAAEAAARAGAQPRILSWRSPRPGQGAARQARHRLLAQACRRDDVTLLCLAHTHDDRVETLRMRAARNGPETTLAGPGPLDPSPVWPDGRGLMIARPFLDLTRTMLRRYLAVRGAAWIEDPSNDNPAFERVRVRASPMSQTQAQALIARSEAARRTREACKADARDRLAAGARLTVWGGAVPDPAAFAGGGPGAHRAFETLLLAVSGAGAPPSPGLVEAGLAALGAGKAWTGAGAMLTAKAVLGRDPGAAGRAGGNAAAPLSLEAGERGVFDGRFDVTGPAQVEMLGARRPDGLRFSGVPGAFRATLPYDGLTGAVLAGADGQSPVNVRAVQHERIASRVMALNAPAWFDAVSAGARACAALAKPDARSNIGR